MYMCMNAWSFICYQISPHNNLFLKICAFSINTSLTWFLDSNSTVQILLALSSYLYWQQQQTFSVLRHYNLKENESKEADQKWQISDLFFTSDIRPYDIISGRLALL